MAKPLEVALVALVALVHHHDHRLAPAETVCEESGYADRGDESGCVYCTLATIYGRLAVPASPSAFLGARAAETKR